MALLHSIRGRRSWRRARPWFWGALLSLGFALALPSCRGGTREDIVRTTPVTTIEDTVDLGLEACMSDPNIVWTCSAEGLHPDLLTALRQVAAAYAEETCQPIVINSGARTLRRQAELMSAMTRQQLEGMYCRQGYPSYIREILAMRQAHGGHGDADRTYEVLRRRSEGYISSHLSGAAVDVSPSNADVGLLKRLLEEHGFAILDERGLGVNCLHATFRQAPRLIVRE